MATLLLAPPDISPNIIVIDEPELGLHPQAIDALASMVNLGSRYSQIILATHSERLLDSFDDKNVIITEQDKQNHCSIYKCLDIDELQERLSEYSISQLWEKNIIGGQP